MPNFYGQTPIELPVTQTPYSKRTVEKLQIVPPAKPEILQSLTP
jgi:hypothetical protein